MKMVVRIALILLLSTPFLNAQINPITLMPMPENQRGGMGTFSKAVESASKSVNVLGSQSYTYNVPMFNLPGRGGLDLNLTLYYNSLVWANVPGALPPPFPPNAGVYGLNLDIDVPSPGFRLDYGFLEASEPGNLSGCPTWAPSVIVLVDGDASKHNLIAPGGCTSTHFQTNDSSYIHVEHDPNNLTETLTYPDGRVVTYTAYNTGFRDQGLNLYYFRPTQIADANGNTITINYADTRPIAVDTSISSITDTIGRTVTFYYDIGNGQISSHFPNTGAGWLMCVTDGASCNAAGSKTFNFTWNHNYTLRYSFTVIDGVVAPSGTILTVLAGVQRPDQTSVQFNYGDWEVVNDIKEFSNTGNLRYEVSYNFPPATVQQNHSPSYTTQTVFDGVNTETWNYQTTLTYYNLVTSYSITDPMGTTTTSTLSANGDWQDGLLVQQQISGCSPAPCNGSTPRVFKTVNTAWTSDNGNSGTNPRPTSITTTLDDSTKSQVQYASYDSNGNITDMQEFDLGAGAHGPLLRETVTSYASLGSILNKPSDVQVKDGAGNLKARSTLAYDTHGNLTGTTTYANAAQQSGGINGTFTYDQYGNLVGSQIGCCTFKQMVYSAATQFAYPDSVTEGPPGNPASLTTHYSYNMNTGTVATLTDPNNQPTSFTYDVDNRLTSTKTPDNVTVTESYDDSSAMPAVTTSTTANSQVSVTTTDFLGHALSNQTFNGSTLVSTMSLINDALGRPSQVSNPYGPGETPAYTSYSYDALGRKILTTPPALAGVTQQNGSQASYSGATVTSTDPANKQRKQYTDGLGRLVRVDEPGGSTGSPAGGALTINGALQSFNTGPQQATSGHVELTFSGTLQSKSSCSPSGQPCTDSGSISITVGGFSKSANYSSSTGSDSGQTVHALANAFHNDTTSPVDAIYYGADESGNIVMDFVARTKGAATNYPLSTSIVSGNPANFPSPSFQVSAGSHLIGGQDASSGGTIYDSGIVYVSVGSFTASAQYGQNVNNTAALVASALAGSGPTSLNQPGSPVIAAASGSTITLNYKVSGQAGNNVSVNVSSSSYNPETYPSFTSSGATLSGGSDPQPFLLSTPAVTLYSYDATGNLLQVTQGQQTRVYTYDSLGRMTSSQIPETGNRVNNFTYTDFGAISTSQDPRQITATYNYDALNRLSSVQYSDGTPTATYTYGPAGASNFAAGRLTSIGNSAASETYQYDNMGRTLQCDKTIGGNHYIISYKYNPDGQIVTQTYPSSRSVVYSYDSIGRLTQASTNSASTFSVNAYNAAGQVVNATYGNGAQANYGYNNQLQRASILVQNSTPVMSLTYNYGGAQDNGQIQGITDNLNSALSTSYAYDALARLSTAQTTDLTSPGTWAVSYTYDRYSNRLTQKPTGGTANPPSGQLIVDSTTNQIASIGFTYDNAGNELTDRLNRYTYDAIDHITSIAPMAGGTAIPFSYDPAGQRVNKNGTYYIFSGGQVIAEYANGATASSPSAEYVYTDGQRVANIVSGATTYNYWDHLSVRANADSAGNIVRNSATFPFGENAGESGSGLLTKWKFTTYERDSESGQDYGMARFYANILGRFMSLDPVSAHLDNPQSLNRYTYVTNDPINHTDPTGTDPFTGPFGQDCFVDCDPWGPPDPFGCGEVGPINCGGRSDPYAGADYDAVAAYASKHMDLGRLLAVPFPRGSLAGWGNDNGIFGAPGSAMGAFPGSQLPNLADILRTFLTGRPCPEESDCTQGNLPDFVIAFGIQVAGGHVRRGPIAGGSGGSPINISHLLAIGIPFVRTETVVSSCERLHVKPIMAHCDFGCESGGGDEMSLAVTHIGMGEITRACGPVLVCPRLVMTEDKTLWIGPFGMSVGGGIKITHCIP